jgi:hypothetical protein
MELKHCASFKTSVNRHEMIRIGARDRKNRRARETGWQKMLNSCKKFVRMKVCYWKFEGSLNTHVPLLAQQHMVDRHYSLNLKPYSQNTICLCTCRFSTKILRWSAGNFCLQVVHPGRKFFFPTLRLATNPRWLDNSVAVWKPEDVRQFESHSRQGIFRFGTKIWH